MLSQKSYEDSAKGKLYLVPTPIGNLEDMTFRAINILKEVDLIAAEDTRQTQKLLNHFEIQTPQTSFHEHNWQERIPQLVKKLEEGHMIAQVSDAGMPSISDPGFELTKAVIDAGIPVIPLPGASAGVTALIASGLVPQPFYFYGFLKRKKNEQLDELEELNTRSETIILYESPHRLKMVLKHIQKVMGPNRKIVLARELTKRFEEFIRGTIAEVIAWSEETELRGEFCLILEGNKAPVLVEDTWNHFTISEHVQDIMEQDDVSSKEAIKSVAKLRGMKKQDVYAAFHQLSSFYLE